MNRKSVRTERKLALALRPRAEWRVLAAAFMATLLALPVNAAIVIPGDPLASGVRVAPNVLFILDDSGSMAYGYMPDNVPLVGATSTVTTTTGACDDANLTGMTDVACKAYTRNTLSYNPAVTYSPWMNADGNRLTGGTSYTSAYSDAQVVSYTGVKDDGSTGVITTSGTIDLAGAMRNFYVPKDTSQTAESYLGVASNYYLYQIRPGGTDIRRGVYGTIVKSADQVVQVNGNNSYTATLGTNAAVDNTTASVAADGVLVITIQNGASGNGNRGLDYTVYSPSGAQVASGSLAKSTSTTSTIYPTVVGAYKITVQRTSNNSTPYTLSAVRFTTNSCVGAASGSGFINCTSALPSSRTLAAELTNYATWYSYFRTRSKAAKAGAADAFSSPSLGNKVRVGYTSIWDTNPFYIPVTDGNDGRFVNNDGTNGNPATKSRSKWYSHLFTAAGSSTTPLRPALKRAGEYFSNNRSGAQNGAGPYGPETGTAVLSCRQNFSILTTDGYWNESSSPGNLNYDGANFPATITGPKGKSYTFPGSDPTPLKYDDSYADTLADVAMYYWNRDLMTSLTNNVSSDDEDPAFWQHMVTFGIAIGLATTTGWSTVAGVPANPTWPQVSNNHPTGIDDLLHAAVNGHGAFVSATNPTKFAEGLSAALAKINERTASFSNVGATSSTELNTGAMIFSASYLSGAWTGLLRAENALDGTEVWNTTNTGSIPTYTSRNIYTRGGTLTGGVGSSGTGGGTNFPTLQQTAVFVRTGGPANYEVTGADNALYIRGDQTKEGVAAGKLRPRTTLLGDIVNSSPAYVKDSNTVYVGANDGMLHAFDAANGRELFAYIPGIINFGHLGDLSRRDYDHRWFVDGPIAISARSLSPTGDKNILVGTLGRGGRGLYALDVTTPSSFGTGDVKWERSSTSATPAFDNMGLVLGKPVLAKVRAGGSTSAVVLGNGINSGSDQAVLVVLNMDDGSVIREIPTDSTTNNGLFAPTGVYAADGKTLVYAYAGDLQGNVWKFDLTSSAPGSWSSKKIFHAEKTAGTPQPITGGIASAVDPRTNKRWVFFGTGSFLTGADGNDIGTDKQSVYGVIDDITTGSAYTRSDLTQRSVTADGAGERYFQELVNLTTKGWYLDLPDKGERMVLDAQMDGSYLQFNTMMPSGDSCADAEGSGYINAITPFADMSSNVRSYFDLDGDGYTDDAGTSGRPTGSVKTSGIPTLSLLLPGEGRYGTKDGVGKFNKGRPQWNRVSWRELRED